MCCWCEFLELVMILEGHESSGGRGLKSSLLQQDWASFLVVSTWIFSWTHILKKFPGSLPFFILVSSWWRGRISRAEVPTLVYHIFSRTRQWRLFVGGFGHSFGEILVIICLIYSQWNYCIIRKYIVLFYTVLEWIRRSWGSQERQQRK